jgi:hypothetical protein
VTTVVNMYHILTDWKSDRRYVYIGRAHGKAKNGYFGNPFVVGKDGTRDEILEKYREYFLKRLRDDAEFFYQVAMLDGKILVCFCKPAACHGDIIVEFLENGLYASDAVLERSQDTKEHT